jgi:LDH2 family malate/lactate/ureidoglycolate dehydrogenase
MDMEAVGCIPLPVLHAFCCDVLQAAGVPADGADLVAHSLTQADASGLSSHGVVRLLPVYVRRLQAGTTRARPRLQVVSQRGHAALVDGDSGLGQVVGHWAMDMAISMAREGGVAVVGVRNSSHFGIAAFFLWQAVQADMIGVALTNASPNMPPAGGRLPFFGTNPLAIGLPCGVERPVLLDMSTSLVARGKIVMAQLTGHDIPLGWAIDKEGRPTQDATAALEGSVLPLGGYKGAGLALVIDALCGILTGAAFGPHIVNFYDESERVQNLGHLFAAMDIGSLMPVESFKARMDQLVREVHAQPRQPGVDRIYVPGEIEQERMERSIREGVPLSEEGLQALDALAQRLGVSQLGERLS